jgi:hypothetical protein
VTTADVADLMKYGITHFIDCRSEFNDAQLFKGADAPAYLWNGVPDDFAPKPVEWFRLSIAFGFGALLSSPRNCVYAHCHHGLNRGPITAGAIMMAFGITPNETRGFILLTRPVDVIGLQNFGDAVAAVRALGYAP